ncbi:mandelate racemase/muconate lactonizing enzyme family protein [Rathayibacter soli]|uniref:mandelate racemase/muconate lactonizing enzyme family protein n=1 Tax=Rathayibacter soli TaxID=3144168 RepID=UPI0027E513C3|nr:mandelate racemase/muconate lactonizing enzyme family protein [Glaciibacter superstes]
MKITGVDCHVLLDPDFDTTAASSAQDDFVVEIHTDEGLIGLGETDLNPWIARACIEAPGTHNMGLGLTEMLIGADPLDIEGLWQRLYVGSAMNGRRGAVINAIGAIDIALHDLRGKALNKPCYELMGGAVRAEVTPYASLQPQVSSFEDYRDSLVEWALRAKEIGFRAVKSEVTLAGPFAHNNLREPWEKSTEVVSAVRSAIGPDVALLVDVQYAFPDAETALAVLADWQEFDLTFVETPLWPDDLEGYARLAAEQPIPVAAGEWLTTRFEFASLIDTGNISVAQPDIGRVGGLTEAMRVAELAESRGRRIVPHLWKTGLSIATAVQLAAVSRVCDYVEFLPAELSESAIRQNLTSTDIFMVDGRIPLPTGSGLGIEINREAMREFEDVARRKVPRG